jgi:uncharacterized membrane protein YedE/YeeE
MKFLQFVAVLVSGALFGWGLSLSTMVQPQVVLSFLRFQDWGLMLVLGGAMGVTLLAYRLGPCWLPAPLLGGSFGKPVATLNRDTLVGAAIFGIGWGLCGVCPGPAIAGLGTGNTDLFWALGGILAGAGLQGWQAGRR